MSTEEVKKESTEATGTAGAAANGAEKDSDLPAFASPSLYVGSLKDDVTEGVLFEIFNAIGAVASIRVCRDTVTKRSLGYAYVNYHSMEDAARALEELNDTDIKGRNCRVMWSQRDPSLRKTGVGNIFIKNLALDIDTKTLQETFESFGEIRSCKIVMDKNGKSKGYGFVHFVNEADAADAIEKVNGAEIADNVVTVEKFVPRAERLEKQGDPREKFTNCYVKNLPDEVTNDDELKEMFSKYGTVTSTYLKKDADGKSKGFGFVNFATSEEAHAAVDALNEKEFGERVLYVGRAQKKTEREEELRARMERKKAELQSKYQGVNVYVKNLDDSVDDDKLREEFKQFGTISSCRVMRDDKNVSRGFGFVCFSTPEEATRAVTEMNGKMIAAKPIYAALHQRKEERRMQLEAMHARRGKQMPMAAGVPGMMGGFGAPGAQMYYAAAAAQGANNPAQFAAYQQQAMMMAAQQRAAAANGGVVPGWGPMMAQGNFMRGGPQGGMRGGGGRGAAGGGRGGQMPGGARGGAAAAGGRGYANAATMMAQQQQQQLYQQQQLMAQQQQAAQAAQQQISMQQMVQQPLDPKAISSLPTDQQKLVVGEKLYPKIYAQEPKLAGKITGMLLDSYFTEEVIHLLETPEALAAKVKEAVTVLEKHQQAQAGN